MYRSRKTLHKKYIEKNNVDDLLVNSYVVPRTTTNKNVENALFDLFENVTNKVNVHDNKPKNKSKHVVSSSEKCIVKKVWIRKDTTK